MDIQLHLMPDAFGHDRTSPPTSVGSLADPPLCVPYRYRREPPHPASRELVRAALPIALVAMVILLATPTAHAQTVTDPTTAVFEPSSDHDLRATDGSPLVASYTLQIFVAGSETALHSIDIGKPPPDPDGLIRFRFIDLLTAPLASGQVYEARVSAVGPAGSGVSDRSNPFTISAPCRPSLSVLSASVGAAAITGTVSVDAAGHCPWTAVANDGWLTITGGGTGTGAGTVSFAVAANPGTLERSGTLTIAGLTFSVRQAGACHFTISPGTVLAPARGISNSLAVKTTAGCAWSASGMPPWVTIATDEQTGPGLLSYTIAPNPGGTRSATLRIAGRPFVLSQASALPAPPGNLRIVGGQAR